MPVRAVILIYHRVAPGPSDGRYTVSSSDFAQQMQHLAHGGYHVAGLGDVVRALKGDVPLPDRSVAITFDDGFVDTHANATPILERHGFGATHFVVTGLAGKHSAWMTAEGYPASSLLGWAEIVELKRSGFEIGSHTVTHPKLSEIGAAQAKAEIHDSKKSLEDRLGAAVRFFAYPFGRFDRPVRDLVAGAGYEAACSTLSGFVNASNDRFALRRIEVFGDDTLRAFSRKLEFGTNEMSSGDVLRYYVRRALKRAKH
jgi:peptidoglycan/xylan/chitin deacetylase (PgdA/CDA1 family)